MSITLNDIQKAKERIAPYITETPLLRLHSLDAYLGCQVYAKAECMQITGAFKLRGALNKICQLTEEQLQRGIVAASSGNHGKAVAYTARMLHTKATIVMPYTAPPVKVEAIRSTGRRNCPVRDVPAFSDRPGALPGAGCGHGAAL